MTRWRTREDFRWTQVMVPAALLLIIAIAAVASDTFVTEANLRNLMRQVVTNGLISLGMLVVILAGGIDLSVGAVVALSGIVAAELQSSMPTPLAILIAIGVAVGVGLVNGGIIARFAIAPFIVTLGTMSAIRGLVYVFSETPVTPSDPSFLTIGSAFLGPLPAIFVFMGGAYLVVSFVLARTTPGICSFFAGVAGVVLASRVGISQPSVGAGVELDAIAACVIGGAILGGGGGSVRGTFMGVVLLGLISNLLNQFNVQSYYQQIFKGALIVIAVLARRRER
jgi:ribose transport system permease protein